MNFRHVFSAVAMLLLSSSAVFCGPSAGGFCDAACDCRGCSDREYDDCLHDFDDEDRRADRFECYPEWDDYAACVSAGDACRGNDFDHYCHRERDRYRHCLDHGGPPHHHDDDDGFPL